MNRVEEMLQIAANYIREFYPDGTIKYDDADCDGYCVAEACELAKAELEHQLQHAHRQGWEQGKRECVNIANNLFKYESGYCHYREDVGDAIAAMEYGGKANVISR